MSKSSKEKIAVDKRSVLMELQKNSSDSVNVIAKRLGLTKAAVSQYLSGKRAAKFELSENAIALCKASAEKITMGSHVVSEVTYILEELWKTDLICKLHKAEVKLPEQCNFCNRWNKC